VKVALIGTHGVGKTTLCFELAARLKRRDVDVEMVREVARHCPLPINRETSSAAQAWILHTQMAWELEAAARHPLVDVLRDRTSLAREVEGGRIENVYRLQIMNTRESPHRVKVTVSGLPTLAVASESDFEIPAATSKQVPLRLQIDAGQAASGSHKIELQVVDAEDPSVAVRERSVFLVR